MDSLLILAIGLGATSISLLVYAVAYGIGFCRGAENATDFYKKLHR